MQGLIMDTALTIPKLLQRANTVFSSSEVVSMLPSGQRHVYRYADMYRRILRLMNAMRKLGIKKGDRVATFAWNDYRHLELYFAAPCMGAVLHTINIRLSEEQLEYIINHAEDSIIFVNASLVPQLEKMRAKLKTVRYFVVINEDGQLQDTTLSPLYDYETLIAEAEEEAVFVDIDERDAAGLCYTSGTTGNPKGVLYSHRGNYIHALMSGMTDALGIGEQDSFLPAVPLFHANAWGSPFLACMTGAKMVFAGPNLSGDAVIKLCTEEDVTCAMGVPTIWMGVLQALQDGANKPPFLKRLVIGGSSAPRAMIVAYREQFDIEIIHAWGMTELSPLGTLNHLPKHMLDAPLEVQYDQMARVGRPAACVEMKIVDDNDLALPWDGEAVGELLVRGPSVASDYYKDTENQFQFTNDGWFRTGDIACITSDAVLQIMDRSKDMVKSGGEWISSVEMENAIMACAGVVEAVVVARPDDKWSERPVAFVVSDSETLTKDKIIAALQPHFAKWQIPEENDIQFIDTIPRTSVGKFDKKVLRKPLWE